MQTYFVPSSASSEDGPGSPLEKDILVRSRLSFSPLLHLNVIATGLKCTFVHSESEALTSTVNCCRQQKRTWSSSRVFGGHYLVNQKYDYQYFLPGVSL